MYTPFFSYSIAACSEPNYVFVAEDRVGVSPTGVGLGLSQNTHTTMQAYF